MPNQYGLNSPEDIDRLPVEEITKQRLRNEAFPQTPVTAGLADIMTGPAPVPVAATAPITSDKSANSASMGELNQLATNLSRTQAMPVPSDVVPTSVLDEPLMPATGGHMPVGPVPVTPITLSESTTTRGRTELPAADRKALDDATKAQAEATKVGTEALVSGARAHAAAQDVVTAQMDANLAKLKASDDARAAAVDAAKRNYTQAVSQYENQPLDSGRFWRNQGTGDKVAYAVAIGLGTLGQIFGGQQRNLVLDSIQNAIKDDIDQQKADLAKKKDVAGIKRTVYTDILTQTGNERLAELGALDMGLKTAQQRIEAALISSKLPQIQAQGQQQLADIQAARAKLNADIDKETVSTATKTEQVLPKKAEAVSPLKDVPKEFLDRHAAAQSSLDTLGRIEALGTKDRAGKIKYTYDSIKRTLGLEDADFSRDTAELTRLLMENSKVFGANPSNRDVEILAQSVPELKSNPEAFAQKLAVAKAAADSSLANTERYFPELSQFRKPTIREERPGK